jgi:asparagine synthase (glutamine-hydrolysing)
MCGIAGFCGLQDKKLIKQMSSDMEHRGPDGDGFYLDENLSMVNRRLAIIDRAGGDQPIYNEDKTIVVVYNGEIYNYRELREELEAKGHVFRTHSDTEIIVHGYEEWGDTSFDRYNGMFGIALYDIKKKRLLLVRDHFGIKPLYYSVQGSTLLFGSEIKPIINSGLVEKAPNDETIYRYLMYRIHDEGEETFFKGVRRLLPGQMMIFEKGVHRIQSYTKIRKDLSSTKPKAVCTQEDIETFEQLLTKAIQMRLVSEVPVGTCLSGGLDSSTVVAVANKLLREKAQDSGSLGKEQKAYSAVFPGSVNDEEKYIDALIAQLKHIDNVKVFPKPEEFFTDLEDFILYQEEPTISTGPYAQYQVMRKAHEDVTVLLDGQGADEMMAGYLPYYFVYIKQMMKRGEYFKLLREVWSSRDIFWKLALQKLTYSLGFQKKISMGNLLKDSFKKQYSKSRFQTVSDNLKERLLEDIFGNSLQSLLRYEDKNAMRFSIEGRVPFLDMNLIKFLFTLPDDAIIQHGWNKSILRKAFASYLPDMISQRRNKIGFTTPENEWFLRMKNRIYGIFMTESFANRPYWNQSEVVKAFELFIQGKNDDTMLFWRMLNLEIWMRLYFDEKQAVSAVAERPPFSANLGKEIRITTEAGVWQRYPIKTELFAKGDDYASKITQEVVLFRKQLLEKKSELSDNRWFAIVSEKIVAISQGRSYFIWDINPTFWGKTLSKFVTRTPYGIGLGSPWTMQLAINEVGLPRILFAALASIVTKPFGVKGVFYRIAGRTVASIDGPTEYSLYPSNVSAKLGPKNPDKAAQKIRKVLESQLSQGERSLFDGVVIIDANDLGRDILGNATAFADKEIADIMRDNPMGQGSEQTPVVMAFKK